LARPDLIEYLCHAQLPFNTGAVALAAANASLDDHAFRERSRRHVQAERQFLYDSLEALGVPYLPSQANFVLIWNLPLQAQTLGEALMRRGIIVRAVTGWGVPGGLRVTLGTRAQNQRFVQALQAELATARLEVKA